VHPVDAERRACSLSSAPNAVAPGHTAAAPAASRAGIPPAANGVSHALRLARIDHARLAALLHAARQRGDAFEHLFPGALGAVCIGAAGSPADAMARMLAVAAPELPLAPVPMALLDAGGHARGDAVCEIWQCDASDLRSARRGTLQYRYSETAGLVFGSIVVQETQEPADIDRDGGTPLERATYDAYRALFDVLDTLDLPHPLRIWNTVPAINAHQFGIERYRQFNIGRQRAFDACRRALTGGVPAACALGSVVPAAGDTPPAAPLAIHFIASRTPADPVENRARSARITTRPSTARVRRRSRARLHGPAATRHRCCSYRAPPASSVTAPCIMATSSRKRARRSRISRPCSSRPHGRGTARSRSRT
jgi:hypothetical protein